MANADERIIRYTETKFDGAGIDDVSCVRIDGVKYPPLPARNSQYHLEEWVLTAEHTVDMTRNNDAMACGEAYTVIDFV